MSASKNQAESLNNKANGLYEESKSQKKEMKSKFVSKDKKEVGNVKQKSKKANSEFLYELVGILVHSGSANGGHYYSYIKERNVFREAESVPDKTRNWFEFNDRIVKEFDIKNLAKECFGTPLGKKKEGSTFSPWTWESHSNAYLLFYEKVSKKENL